MALRTHDEEPELTADPPQRITPAHYRKVFGALPTGVVAITGVNDADEKLGLIVGTFQSLSLEPPLVMFCVDRSSSTWPKLRKLRHFSANILAVEQLEVCRSLSRKGPKKFDDLPFETGAQGTPRLVGSVAWLDCVVEAEVAVGDHYMVVGAVVEMGEGQDDALLFKAGGFGQYAALPVTATPREPSAT